MVLRTDVSHHQHARAALPVGRDGIPEEITAGCQNTAVTGKSVSCHMNGEVKHRAALSK